MGHQQHQWRLSLMHHNTEPWSRWNPHPNWMPALCGQSWSLTTAVTWFSKDFSANHQACPFKAENPCNTPTPVPLCSRGWPPQPPPHPGPGLGSLRSLGSLPSDAAAVLPSSTCQSLCHVRQTALTCYFMPQMPVKGQDGQGESTLAGNLGQELAQNPGTVT